MNAPLKPIETAEPTRRELMVVGATLAGGALLVGCSPKDIIGLGSPKTNFGAFGPFVRIGADGWVTVMNKHQEMGQGNHAGLAAIVAEELDADWTKVRVEFAPAMAKIYANTLVGVQITGGSTAIANSWMQLRKAGAGARAMFVQAAAARWSVPAAEVTVKDGVVSHASGKSAGFGELLADAAKVAPPADPILKDPKSFTLIGTDRVRRKDSVAKSTGNARYTQDVHEPEMLTAMVAHPVKFGATVESFDDTGCVQDSQRRGRDRKQHLGRTAGPGRAEGGLERGQGRETLQRQDPRRLPRHRRGQERAEGPALRQPWRRVLRVPGRAVPDHLRLPLPGPRLDGADELCGAG